IHHIISDGISQELLVKDFNGLYENDVLPELRVQYKDYAGWQNREKEKESMGKQETFWLKELGEGDQIPVLHLPLDYARPGVRRYEGNLLLVEIGAAETRLLREMAQREKVTLYMLLLTLFYTWLSKLCGQEDIIVGTPAAGRGHADLEGIIGMFVNTLAIRNYPSGTKPFNSFLKEVKEKTIEALENQDYQ
ncbi:MAG: hypothetical protein GY765_28720, partial [bacterium]|nr:hypothetical protein [bacterium]